MIKQFTALVFLLAFVFLCPCTGNKSVNAENAPQDYIALPIVMYHSISNQRPGKFSLTPAQLEKDFVHIKQNGYTTIVAADLIAYQKGVPLPEKPIMLTFDDGYMNNFYNVFPLLQKYDLKCIMSIVGILTDANYISDGTPNLSWAHMTYEQIREANDSGLVEIQNHTYNLHSYGKGRRGLAINRGEDAEKYKAMLKDDLLKLNNKLYERSGVKCTAIAYPYGSYCKEAIEAAKEIGLKAGFTCIEGVNKITPETDFFQLKRCNRPAGISSEKFFSKLQHIK
ncbi:MAG: polysaccharide deacetylase family protein [Firmicutes bacterium]|nr:polysaccharide deacetylase family protein [Bacillota bacterium]